MSGFTICNHCGAMWDDNHENNGCPVMATTARILGATNEQAQEIRRKNRKGLKEKLQAVISGRADW